MGDKLGEAIQKYGGSARDARIGAIGADQVRDLYKSDKQEAKELAKELNDKYLATSAAGIAGGATAAGALTAGVVPTLVSEAGGAAGSYVGNKVGAYADEKFDTKWITPTLSIVGGLGSGIGSYKGLINAGTKGLLKGNSVMYGKNFVSDVVATSLNKASKVPHKPTVLVKPHSNEIKEDVIQITFTPKQPSRGATSYKFYERPSNLSELELKGIPKSERPSYYKNLGKSKISPEESAGIPKGERNNGRYNGVYFFRTLGEVPSIDPRGYVQIGNAHRPIVNTTTDQLVHTHDLYPSGNRHVIVINPEGLRGSTLASLDPSDTMIINDKSLKIKPKHVIFISGDSNAIAEATKKGFRVISTPRLKRGIDNDHKFYHDEIRRIIDTYFSRPTLDVYRKMSRNTGLPLSVEEFTGKNFPKNVPKDVNGTKQDFKRVVYDPASTVEYQTGIDHGLNVDFEHKSRIPFQTYMQDGRGVSTSSGHTYKSKPRLIQRGQPRPYHSEDDKILYQRLKTMIKNLKSKYKPLKKDGGKICETD